jgi:succinate dehydrogenase / fumarate reductase membrane anchor subunit
MGQSRSGIGTKRHVVGAHYGFKDWLLQRVTAVIMAIYTLVLISALLVIPSGYDAWAGFMFHPIMKWFTILALFSLVYHAWIGARDIVMDYIKPVSVRLFLYTVIVLWLAGCAVYGVSVVFRW